MQTATPGTIGAGQQDPQDSNSDFDVTAFIVSQMIAVLEIMLPVQVTAVHPGTGTPPTPGTVDVQLLVSLVDGAGNGTDPGIVYGVPYFRSQGGPWAIVIDPAKDDFGYIIGASRDISKVKNSPGVVLPGSFRKYCYSDGIYMGGCFNGAPSAWVWLKPDGTFNITDKPGNAIKSATTGMTILDVNGNQILTAAGFVNIVTASFQVNGIPVTVP